MQTSHNGPHRISGHVVRGHSDRPMTTAKAVYATVDHIAGEDYIGRPDTEWLPRSICTDLQVFEAEEDGCKFWAFTATVPAWWIRKLDNRPAWVHQGLSRPPMGQRPY